MRVVVFGGTGPAGLLVIERALREGHHVVAYARSPDKLTRHDRLEVVVGGLDDAEAIARSVHGADAVLSLIGPGSRVVPGELRGGMANIVRAAEHARVKRLVVLATPSASDAHDQSDWLFAAMIALVKLGVRKAYDEIVAMATIVRASSLDWTLVRVPLLTDASPTGRVRAGYLGQGVVRARLSRGDLADFMVAQLTDATWSRKAPAISS